MAAAQIGQGTNSFCLFVSSLLFIELGTKSPIKTVPFWIGAGFGDYQPGDK
jgi:hypothetical protein